jgi:tRNA(Ile)-lysidine synthase
MSLSAGKDSMFLLHALRGLAGEYGLEIGIFHLNHLTRGAESDLDESHIERYARLNAIEIIVKRHDFTTDPHPGESFEEYARKIRYRLAGETAAARGYNKIATGHTMDDNVETVLMRVFGGTGIYGLQGIPPKRGTIIRPLLAVTSDEIYGFLKDHTIEFREDSSNNDLSYTRNFIRHEVIPLVRKRFPMIGNSVSSLIELAGENVALIDGLLQENYKDLLTVSGDSVYIDAGILADNYPAFCYVVSRAIRDHFRHPVNRSMLDEIHSKYMVDRANISIYADKSICVNKIFKEGKSRLKMSPQTGEDRQDLTWEYRIDLENFQEAVLVLREIGISITVKTVDYGYFEKFIKNGSYIFLALENSVKTIYIRNRRKGDRIKTEQGTKKIKDLLIEKKLDGASKDQVPLFVSGDSIAACMPGFLFDIPNRVSSDFIVDKKSKKVLVVFKN